MNCLNQDFLLGGAGGQNGIYTLQAQITRWSGGLRSLLEARVVRADSGPGLDVLPNLRAEFSFAWARWFRFATS